MPPSMATSQRSVLLLHPDDNVAIATATLAADSVHTLADGRSIVLRETVPFGHKLAVSPIPKGAAIRKYGQTVGFASRDIEPGAWVHVHNVEAGDVAVLEVLPP